MVLIFLEVLVKFSYNIHYHTNPCMEWSIFFFMKSSLLNHDHIPFFLSRYLVDFQVCVRVYP